MPRTLKKRQETLEEMREMQQNPALQETLEEMRERLARKEVALRKAMLMINTLCMELKETQRERDVFALSLELCERAGSLPYQKSVYERQPRGRRNRQRSPEHELFIS